MDAPGAFWADLAEDLKDPEFLREYVVESIRIAAVDSMVNELDAARVSSGLSKAALARAINMDPATMRRLFSGGASNPTLGTLAEVAAALGLKVKLEPFSEIERSQVTRPLIDGEAVDTQKLARYLATFRHPESHVL
ncbi:transcriptional regulator with XRE-family HTH domain [Arthrobacter stackebrandtii]|uniref:Transcriptional regulator with XRE-family HTH domain n=1 Tax=Arthrobacter stackebrandtii TaxID=272161 RepID=A0ABS4YTV8_9MICC|nr:helix-turn-helix transcriptional regulator [Arthrobacter stackebrandtii]MBP2411837.1 transcriptional regulator with XRE-family HTH domain [Arthrobacter stackebrandtii]PYG99127.1 XRE family transcriptional regulator [Arthrobacter stackebrandtii]